MDFFLFFESVYIRNHFQVTIINLNFDHVNIHNSLKINININLAKKVSEYAKEIPKSHPTNNSTTNKLPLWHQDDFNTKRTQNCTYNK